MFRQPQLSPASWFGDEHETDLLRFVNQCIKRERERQRDGQTDRLTETQRDRKAGREMQRERHGGGGGGQRRTQRGGRRQTDRQRQRETRARVNSFLDINIRQSHRVTSGHVIFYKGSRDRPGSFHFQPALNKYC